MIRRTACLIARRTDPCFNLALEKHLLDTLPEETAILLLWQTEPSLVVGRFQNPWQECDVEGFLEAGGRIVKRLSGGAAQYQDEGDISYTLMCSRGDFSPARMSELMALCALAAGLSPQPGAHGEVTVGGLPFSVSACFRSGRAAYQHGLIRVENRHPELQKYITAPLGQSAALLSNLSSQLTVEDVQQALYFAFSSVYGQPPALLDERLFDERTLSELSAQLADPLWVYPEALDYTFSVRERFPWGSVTALLLTQGGAIRRATLFTDSPETALFERIQSALQGCPFLISAISSRFESKLEKGGSPALAQMAADVCQLICGRMRAMDRTPKESAEGE